MQVIYTGEEFPNEYDKSIFLVGPTPRSEEVTSWRPRALELLEEYGYDGVVFVPEPRDGKWKLDYTDQLKWESQGLSLADCILTYVPRDLSTMPAFTTNVEFGKWMGSGKVVFGAPPESPKNEYLRHWCSDLGIIQSTTLEDTVKVAINMVGDGAMRKAGERYVPLHIWQTDHFHQWYWSLLLAGNRLDYAEVLWDFRVGQKKDFVFLYVLKVHVWISSEGRHKKNEFVISRPDISTILLYQKGDALADTKVVLVREFRSPVNNPTGFVWELPGGSSFRPGMDAASIMAEECQEEVGLTIDPSRVKFHEVREMNPTLTSHRAHLFSAQLTDSEVVKLFEMEKSGVAHGVKEDSERTYVHVRTVREIMEETTVSWSMLGMILSVLTES